MAPANSPPRMVTLVLLTALSVLSLNMFLPSLKQIAAEYDVEYGVISLALGGYLAVSAVLQTILGPLSDKIGRRPVMLFGMAVFTLASVGCALAESAWVFLAFRMMQCLIGVGMVLSRAVVRDMAPPQEAARLLAVMGTAMALAPLLGPVFGGYLDEFLGWRATFWFFAIAGLAMVVLTWVDMGETNLTPSARFADQFRSYPALFQDRLFWAYCVLLVFSIGGFYVFLGGAAQVGQETYGLSPGMLGLGMGSISGGFMLGNIISTRMARVWGIVRLMIIGRWAGTLGPLAALLAIAAGLSHPAVMFGGAIFIGLGNGLTLPGANAGVMSVAPHLAGSASGLSGALTLAGGAAISTLVGVNVAGPLGVYVLLAAMVATSAVGLVASFYVARLEAARAGS